MRKGQENQIIQFLLDKGSIRGAILDSTDLVKDMISFHNYGPVESFIMGQVISAASILTVTVKGQDRLNIAVECGGPMGGWSADFNADGDIRCHLKNNPIQMDIEKAVTIDNLYGPGFLHMTRMSEGSKEPFRGSVELRYPDIASNLAYYYLTSEQTPSAFAFSVEMDSQGILKNSAALFLQVLPDADEFMLQKLQEKITSIKSLAKEVVEVGDGVTWIEKNFSEFIPSIIGFKNCRFFCPCSRDQIIVFIKGLGKDSSTSMLDDNKEINVKCHSCSQNYCFNQNELEEIFGS